MGMMYEYENEEQREGPVEVKPAPYFSCGSCKHHTSTMVRSGNDPIRASHCHHTDVPEDKKVASPMSGNIGANTAKTPDWCPVVVAQRVALKLRGMPTPKGNGTTGPMGPQGLPGAPGHVDPKDLDDAISKGFRDKFMHAFRQNAKSIKETLDGPSRSKI